MLDKLSTEKRPKLGLALGGGAARGISHIGALKAFHDAGIEFDYLSGTSVGSIVGASYAAGLSWEQMYKLASDLDMKDFLKWRKWSFGYDSEAIGRFMIQTLGDCKIEELNKPFAAVAVDVRKCQEYVFKEGNVSTAVKASCSVPGVFSPVNEQEMLLVDGGVLNNVPANIVRDMGADIVVGIDLSAELGEGAAGDGYFEVLYTVFNIMVRNNSLLGHRHANIMVEPDLEGFPYHVIRNIDDMVVRGEEAVIKVLPRLKTLLRSY